MADRHVRPRTQISLPKDIHDIFSEFALISEKPRSVVMAEILIESASIYKDILLALQASNNNAEQFQKEIKDKLLLKTSDALQQTLNL
jgi:hypothetical protein